MGNKADLPNFLELLLHLELEGYPQILQLAEVQVPLVVEIRVGGLVLLNPARHVCSNQRRGVVLEAEPRDAGDFIQSQMPFDDEGAF